jgi:CRISPR-associated protein Cas2
LPRIVVFYDISNDHRRQKVAKLLEAMGLIRIQRSVFIGRGGIGKAKEVVRAATRLIDKRTDSLAAVVVPDDYASKILVAGSLLNTPQKAEQRIITV